MSFGLLAVTAVGGYDEDVRGVDEVDDDRAAGVFDVVKGDDVSRFDLICDVDVDALDMF